MAIRKPSPPSVSLPVISEDRPISEPTTNSPPIPPRSLKRPSNGNFKESGLSYFTYHTSSSSWEDDSIEGHDSEKLAQLRRDVVNNKHVAKRGGWLRLCLVLGIVSFFIIGLAVGLAFGLKNRSKNSRTDDQVIPISKMTAAFPVGSYSINTYLSILTTNCTSNPATWRCYPYTTYSQSESNSAATFDWIISSDPKTPTDYFISSTPNYFSITFTNISLSLQAAGTADEHYFFETSIQKSTNPATQLSSKNVAATCSFNNAILQGYLYTKMAKTYPNSGGNSTKSESGAYAAWPYAVMIQQVAMSGASIPTCLDASGTSLGDFSVPELGKECDCSYLNTGT